MTDSRHQHAKRIFLAARERAPAERAGYLDATCGDDTGLRHEVEDLLAHDARTLDQADTVRPRGRRRWIGSGAVRNRARRHPIEFTRVDEDAGSRGPSIPPDLARQAASRLRLVGFLVAGVFAVTWLVPVTAGGRLALDLADPFQWVPPTLAIVVSIVMGIAAGSRIAPLTLVRWGLVYQVVISYSAIWSQYWGAFVDVPADLMDADVVGVSQITSWMLLYTVVVPTQPIWALVALFGSASAPAVTYGFAVRFDGAPPLEAGPFFFILVFPYLLTVVYSYVAARIIYGLGVEVSAAKELGSYRLEERLGAGGMGEVWRARHHLLARPAAIKLIRRDAIGTDPAVIDLAVRRFEREAQVTATLRSPHTVELYDFGAAADGSLYYVMELLDGVDLDQMVRRFGPLPPARTAYLVRQACRSLAEAHRYGLFHGDVKPANLFVCRQGDECDVLKVLDFGLVRRSRAARDLPEGVARAGLIAGTPSFMAPEVIRGDAEVDGRADIYALGCVLYWALTGRDVYEGQDIAGILAAHLHHDPEPPSRHALQIPPALDDLVLRCLAKDRGRRFSNAEELADALLGVPLDSVWTGEHADRWWREHAVGPDPNDYSVSEPIHSNTASQ